MTTCQECWEPTCACKCGELARIAALEAWQLDFHLGNTVKYISRSGKKGDAKEG